MKKFLVLIFALITLTAFIAAGCGETSTGTNTPGDSSVITNTSDADDVDETTEAETEKETTQAEQIDYKGLLTNKKWIAQTCYVDGQETGIQDEYGSVIKNTGTYLEFKDDGTFNCVLGLCGCSGTYSLNDDGDISVTKTVLYNGSSEGKEINETEQLETEGKYDSIKLTVDSVTVLFK